MQVELIRLQYSAYPLVIKFTLVIMKLTVSIVTLQLEIAASIQGEAVL
jgi:hypothetical protein